MNCKLVDARTDAFELIRASFKSSFKTSFDYESTSIKVSFKRDYMDNTTTLDVQAAYGKTSVPLQLEDQVFQLQQPLFLNAYPFHLQCDNDMDAQYKIPEDYQMTCTDTLDHSREVTITPLIPFQVGSTPVLVNATLKNNQVRVQLNVNGKTAKTKGTIHWNQLHLNPVTIAHDRTLHCRDTVAGDELPDSQLTLRCQCGAYKAQFDIDHAAHTNIGYLFSAHAILTKTLHGDSGYWLAVRANRRQGYYFSPLRMVDGELKMTQSLVIYSFGTTTYCGNLGVQAQSVPVALTLRGMPNRDKSKWSK